MFRGVARVPFLNVSKAPLGLSGPSLRNAQTRLELFQVSVSWTPHLKTGRGFQNIRKPDM